MLDFPCWLKPCGAVETTGFHNRHFVTNGYWATSEAARLWLQSLQEAGLTPSR